MFYGAIAVLKRVFKGVAVPDLNKSFNSGKLENKGRSLAKMIKNRIPVVCASPRNRHLAYDWKIRFNETAKIHAFSLSLPEMNHNELAALGHRSGDFSFFFFKTAATTSAFENGWPPPAACFKRKNFQRNH